MSVCIKQIARNVNITAAAMGLALCLGGTPDALAATLQAGTGKTHATPCAAIAAAADGDTIEVAAGLYQGDVCAIKKNNLTIRGVGGRAKMDAAGKNASGKGIFITVGNDITIENFEFLNAKAPDKNGAGIRAEGRNLTVRNCYFHDNENGILASDQAESVIQVIDSEFARNGYGDGLTHNMYINHVKRFVLLSSLSRDSIEGHLVKSRALENLIAYNRLDNKGGGKPSYEIDLPHGGMSIIIGNIIHQNDSTSNSGMIAYAGEGAVNPRQDLYIVNNTFVNERAAGGTFINTFKTTKPAVIRNNAFVGSGTQWTQTNANAGGNKQVDKASFVNLATLDMRLANGSALIDGGVAPGQSETGIPLTPDYSYVHPARGAARSVNGTLDIGAFELGASTTASGTLPPGTKPSASIAKLVLINAATDQVIKTLANGDKINLKSVSATQVNVRAEPAPGPIEKIVFNLNGTDVRTEKEGPYALAGDVSSATKQDFNPWDYKPNVAYVLKVTPYSAGVAGTPMTLTFTLIDDAPAAASPTPAGSNAPKAATPAPTAKPSATPASSAAATPQPSPSASPAPVGASTSSIPASTNTSTKNIITIANPTGTAATKVPYQFGRVFRPGEVMKCPTVLYKGQKIRAQLDVKNRHPDGSLRFTLVSLVLPSIGAGEIASLEMTAGGDCANNGPAKGADILKAFPQFDAAIQLNNGSAGSASARAMIQAGKFKTWSNGPIASTLIVEDHETKSYDFGTDANKSLRPIFHVTFWHETKQVHVRAMVEQSDVTKMQNQTYNVTITSGTTPTTVYSKNDVKHGFASRWTRRFWIGTAPLALHERHGVAYLASTKAIPNYDGAVVLSDATRKGTIDAWNKSGKDIIGNGLWNPRMPDTGGHREIGLFPDWEVYALYDGDAQLWDAVKGNADLAGSWPMYYREGDKARNFMKTPSVVNGLGKVITKDGRPTLWIRNLNSSKVGNGVDYVKFVGATADTNKRPPRATGADWDPDLPHQPGPFFIPYLVTGDFYYLEQLQFWASWGLFQIDTDSYGFAGFQQEDARIDSEVRGEAWAIRNRARAAYASPDGSPEKIYFTRVTESALRIWEATKIGDGADPVRKRWAPKFDTRANALHWWEFEGFPSVATDSSGSMQPWQYAFVMSTLGHLQEMGFNSRELKTWFSHWYVQMVAEKGSNPKHLADGRYPITKNVTGNPYFTTHTDAQDNRTNWTDEGWIRTGKDLSHGYAILNTCAMSFVKDEPGGAAAWDWIYNNSYKLRPWGDNPKWAIKPR